ncbi:hypothetical protein DFH09DRAFT_1311822 [Mycena vulgaris]|nr:hypothetical protein DFH09DRAFT_1311822 [Mycena vulgaris]
MSAGRSEIKIIIVMPPGVGQSTPGMHKWTEQLMIDIADDLKHTGSFGCELHLECDPLDARPRVGNDLLDGFVLCGANTPCMELMRTRNVRAMVLQQPPPHWMSPSPVPLLLNAPLESRPEGFVALLSSSCASCHDDETGAAGSEINKCSGCQLTRFVAGNCRISGSV